MSDPCPPIEIVLSDSIDRILRFEQDLLLFLLSAIQTYLAERTADGASPAHRHTTQLKILESIKLLHLYQLIECHPEIDFSNSDHRLKLEKIVSAGFATIQKNVEREFLPTSTSTYVSDPSDEAPPCRRLH
ncbi:MAG TPA: hypothetical protein PLL06_01100 [Acidobacteriota bacterium]|nr:hypothetical protein [Acidobacteriota bacterium]HMZ78265.1 hypothetical protein [Acidobacteriota bacterium]HNB72453.1 hypothetical protein [Acidobacteriota bacterium]HND20362.1 hypothetical protein [Acidobacteriota bacterium]HNG94096.1 hypothetical protein [Acidobacteriota bacterium]